MLRAAAALALLLASAGCGYFNALYNAQQRFAAAEQAEREGNRQTAMTAYGEAIERAFVSFDKYPDSRWADDALLLIARARFARGETPEAAAAFERLLQQSADAEVREQAHAYLGAARVKLNRDGALAALDSAIALGGPDSPSREFSHLWRARARFATGDTSGGWTDLEQAQSGDAALAADARVEALARSLAMRDSVRWLRSVTSLTTEATPLRWNDTVLTLVAVSARRWSPAFASAGLPEQAGERLPELQRLRLQMLRAELLAAAGDTVSAVDAAMAVGSASSSDVSARARISAARWLLGSAATEDELSRVRSILLPAFGVSEALQIIQRLRAIDILIDRSRDEPVALFAAGELARDELRAPALARALFLRHASTAPRQAWSGKSLLAALDLSVTEAQKAEARGMLGDFEGNVYLQATRGAADPIAFQEAEVALGRTASLLRAEAVAVGIAGDLSVGRALAVRDSVRLVLMRDSLATACTALISTSAAKGIRADSTRAACMRNDTARVNVVLRMDTLLLRPRRDSTSTAVSPDTTALR